MSADDRSGVIDSSKVYTIKAFARILDRQPRWVYEQILDHGLEFVRRGEMVWISGHVFNLWVQSQGEVKDVTKE